MAAAAAPTEPDLKSTSAGASHSLVVPIASLPAALQRQIGESKFFYGRTKFIFESALEEFYDAIAEHTPRTVFVPLAVADVRALHDNCTKYYTGQHAKANTTATTAAAAELDNKSDASLSDLIARVNTAIQSFAPPAAAGTDPLEIDGRFAPPPQPAVFLKLSTRSPKDALSDQLHPRMKQRVEEYLSRTPGVAGDDLPRMNADTAWFVNTTRGLMACTDARTAFDSLLLRSSRVREDCGRFLEFAGAFKMNLIVREFIPMSAACEFRGFVYGGKLTALSQYCSGQYFPELADATNRSEIVVRIRTCFDAIKSRIKAPNYIIDFVVTRASDTAYGRALVVEINPFFADTGACMFSWKSPADRAIINGEKPFELRVRTETVPNSYDHLPSIWADIFRANRKPRPPAAAVVSKSTLTFILLSLFLVLGVASALAWYRANPVVVRSRQ